MERAGKVAELKGQRTEGRVLVPLVEQLTGNDRLNKSVISTGQGRMALLFVGRGIPPRLHGGMWRASSGHKSNEVYG